VRDYTRLRKSSIYATFCSRKAKIRTAIFPWNGASALYILLTGRLISMLTGKILNPHLLSLLARVRHTNSLVIADRGFPFCQEIETVDISLIDDVPTVLQVLSAIRVQFHAAAAFMAKEFLEQNTAETRQKFAQVLEGIPTQHEAHVEFKKRVPKAIGLIRTGDTIQFANTILVSG
jgi:D-ribose pyranase